MENRSNNLKVHQFANSTLLSSRSGFITTSINDQEEDVRRSRIEHLPSHRKNDLSKNPNIVIVFQTIEIERLSLEVETLRISLKDSERQIRNYQMYEVQIKELNENSYRMEEQTASYQKQIEKLSMMCEKLYRELENQKSIHSQQHHDFTYQLTQLQKQLQAQKEKAEMFENKQKRFSEEIVRLNESLFKCKQQITLFQQKHEQANQEKEILQNKLKRSEDQKTKFQGQVQKLNNANAELMQRSKDIQFSLSSILPNLESEKRKGVEISEQILSLKQLIDKKSSQISQIKEVLNQNQRKNQEKQIQIVQKFTNFESILKELAQTKEDLYLLNQRIMEKEGKIANVEFQFKSLKSDNEQLAKNSQAMTNEKRLLERQYQNKIQQHEKQLKLTNEKMKEITGKTNQQLQYLKKQKIIFQNAKIKYQKELEKIKQENQITVNNLCNQLKKSNILVKNQGQNIQSIKKRIEKLQIIILKLKEEAVKNKKKILQNTFYNTKVNDLIALNQNLLQKNVQLYNEIYEVNGQRIDFSTNTIKIVQKSQNYFTKTAPLPPKSSDRTKFTSEITVNRHSKRLSGLSNDDKSFVTKRILEPSTIYLSKQGNIFDKGMI